MLCRSSPHGRHWLDKVAWGLGTMLRVRHEQVHRLINTINEAVFLAEGLGLKGIAASLQRLRQQTLNDVAARNRIDEQEISASNRASQRGEPRRTNLLDGMRSNAGVDGTRGNEVRACCRLTAGQGRPVWPANASQPPWNFEYQFPRPKQRVVSIVWFRGPGKVQPVSGLCVPYGFRGIMCFEKKGTKSRPRGNHDCGLRSGAGDCQRSGKRCSGVTCN
jgi:hypothetical protein